MEETAFLEGPSPSVATMAPLETQGKKPSLSVVIPAYNEEGNLEPLFRDLTRVLKSHLDRYEILVMNDASQDRTAEILSHLAKKNPGVLHIWHHTVNQGTNLSLIELFQKARYELVFFLPADRQIHPDSIVDYLEAMKEGADIVLGWRVRRADAVHRSLFNGCYRLLIRLISGVSFRDAAASDLYKKFVLDQIQLESRGRLLQAEIAIKARALGYRVQEITVPHFPRIVGKSTGIQPKTAWLSLRDLWIVGPRLRRLGARGRKEDSCGKG